MLLSNVLILVDLVLTLALLVVLFADVAKSLFFSTLLMWFFALSATILIYSYEACVINLRASNMLGC